MEFLGHCVKDTSAIIYNLIYKKGTNQQNHKQAVHDYNLITIWKWNGGPAYYLQFYKNDKSSTSCN